MASASLFVSPFLWYDVNNESAFEVTRMKTIWRNLNLFWKLFLVFLLCCLIPLILTASLLYDMAIQSHAEASTEFAQAFASQITTDLNRFVQANDQMTQSVLFDNDTLKSIDDKTSPMSARLDHQLELRRMFQRLITLDSGIRGVCILSEQGNFYALEKYGASIDADVLAQQEWLKAAKAGREVLTISPLHDRSYYDREEDRLAISIVRKVYSVQGYFGLLIVDMEPSALVNMSDQFIAARTNYNIHIVVSDSQGGVLYDSDLTSGLKSWKDVSQTQFSAEELDRRDYYVITDNTEDSRLQVAVIFPRSSLLARANRIRSLSLVILMVMTVIVILVAAVISHSITNPIRKLKHGMRQIEEGVYLPISQNAGQDEINSLVRSYNHMVSEMKRLIQDVYLARINQQNAEYLSLQTQINPHMLFNTLESIRMTALMNGDDDAAKMIKLLAQMFRTVLDIDLLHYTVQSEVDYVEKYIELQNMRFSNHYKLSIQIEEECLGQQIIPVIFQPVLENSIKHGDANHTKPMHLLIQGRIEKGYLLFVITDDGKGMSEERLKEIQSQIDAQTPKRLDEINNSIGLKNIAERLRLRYGTEGRLLLRNGEEKGTEVELRIPLKEAKQDDEDSGC